MNRRGIYKITAMVLVLIMTLCYTPVNQIDVRGEVLPEDTYIQVEVKDGSDTPVTDIDFKVVDDDETTQDIEVPSAYDDVTGIYELNISGMESEKLNITLSHDSVDFTKLITYNSEQTEAYPVTFTENLVLKDMEYDETEQAYVIDVDYSLDNRTITLDSNIPAIFSEVLEEGEDSIIEKIEGNVITYKKPGQAVLTVTPDEDNAEWDFYQGEAKIIINVNNVINSIKILDKNNNELSKTDDIYDITYSNTKSKREVRFSVNAAYSEEFTYEFSDNANIIFEDNKYYYAKYFNGIIEITAIGTGVSQTVKLRVNPKQSAVVPAGVDNLYNTDGNAVTTINSGDTVSVDYVTYKDVTGDNRITVHTGTNNEDFEGTIEYASSEKTVATIDADGEITIVGAGTTIITASADNGYGHTYTPYSFTLVVVKSDISITAEDITVSDTVITNGTLTLKGDILAQNNQSEKVEGLTYTFSADGFDFTDNVITNPDDIERNVYHTITVTTDGNANYNGDTTTFKLMLTGENVDNSQIYSITYKDSEGNSYALTQGFDNNPWALSGDIYVTPADGYFLRDYGKDIDKETHQITVTESQVYNKEHKFQYVTNAGDVYTDPITAREYFGVDLYFPEIKGLDRNASGTALPQEFYGYLWTWYDIKFTVDFKDADKNLYKACLVNNGTEFGEAVMITSDENGCASVTFNINKDEFYNSNFYVRVYDVSGRYTDRSLAHLITGNSSANNNIILDITAPTATITVDESSEDLNKYISEEGTYYSKDVDIVINVADSGTQSSGISRVEIYDENGNLVKSVPYNEKKASDTIIISTEALNIGEDGFVKLYVKAIDNCNNESQEKSVAFYVDKGNPDVSFNALNTQGTNNPTEDGNFYNKQVSISLKVDDAIAGVSTAIIHVGETLLVGTIKDDIATFVLPMNAHGDVYFEIIDNVGHRIERKLVELSDNSNVFKSNFLIIDSVSPTVEVTPVTQPENSDKWYNTGVEFTVNVVDEDISAGFDNITTYVNDVLYSTNDDFDISTNSNEHTVTIDSNWIDRVINDDGSYTVKVVAQDNSGNEGNDDGTVYIDMVAPVVSDLKGVVADSNNTGSVILDLTVDEKHFAESGNLTTVIVSRELDGVVNEYVLNDFRYISKVTTQSFEFKEDGTYTVRAEAVDAAGNTAVGNAISFTIDNTKPFVNVSGVTNGAYVKDSVNLNVNVVESNYVDNTVTIKVTHELNGTTSEISVEDFVGSEKSTTKAYSFTDEGKFVVVIDSVDKAGNTAVTQTVNFFVDKKAPVITLSGVAADGIYTEGINANINIDDNYYSTYTIRLEKTGVYLNETETAVTEVKALDVTDSFVSKFGEDATGADGTIQIDGVQDNDGIYTLAISATDKAGRYSESNLVFSLNGYGSVYTFDNSLKSLNDAYVTTVDEDVIITEYNATALDMTTAKVVITRDGSPISKPVYTVEEVLPTTRTTGNDWKVYRYIISKDNFKYDGVYSISVVSVDEAGNRSENIDYDGLNVRFSVDTTKPEMASITGLEKNSYNASEINVHYTLFDAVSLKCLKVYLDNSLVQEVSEFEDINMYEGMITIPEGMSHKIRFVIEDMAGNLTDTDSEEDRLAGAYPEFNDTVVVSTNIFIIWYSNKVLFVGSIACVVGLVVGVIVIVSNRKKGKK